MMSRHGQLKGTPHHQRYYTKRITATVHFGFLLYTHVESLL